MDTYINTPTTNQDWHLAPYTLYIYTYSIFTAFERRWIGICDVYVVYMLYMHLLWDAVTVWPPSPSDRLLRIRRDWLHCMASVVLCLRIWLFILLIARDAAKRRTCRRYRRRFLDMFVYVDMYVWREYICIFIAQHVSIYLVLVN